MLELLDKQRSAPIPFHHFQAELEALAEENPEIASTYLLGKSVQVPTSGPYIHFNMCE